MQKFEYDPEVKILKVRFKKGQSVDSEVKGNVVLDYDNKGKLLKLEIMDVNLEDLMAARTKGKLPIKLA